MILEKEVKIGVRTINGKVYLQFDFPSHFDEKMADAAIQQWKSEKGKALKNGKVDLIFNCTGMTGFDTEARRMWQATLKELKGETGEIWVVCENIFILGAAKTMGILAGFHLKVTRSINEIGL
jgi:hypothetical protein